MYTAVQCLHVGLLAWKYLHDTNMQTVSDSSECCEVCCLHGGLCYALRRLCMTTHKAYFSRVCSCCGVQAKAASDARLARDIQEAEDQAEANAAEEVRLRQEEWESIDRSAYCSNTHFNPPCFWEGSHEPSGSHFTAPAVSYPQMNVCAMSAYHTPHAQAVYGLHM